MDRRFIRASSCMYIELDVSWVGALYDHRWIEVCGGGIGVICVLAFETKMFVFVFPRKLLSTFCGNFVRTYLGSVVVYYRWCGGLVVSVPASHSGFESWPGGPPRSLV